MAVVNAQIRNHLTRIKILKGHNLNLIVDLVGSRGKVPDLQTEICQFQVGVVNVINHQRLLFIQMITLRLETVSKL